MKKKECFEKIKSQIQSMEEIFIKIFLKKENLSEEIVTEIVLVIKKKN